jgi:hypothetical protein
MGTKIIRYGHQLLGLIVAAAALALSSPPDPPPGSGAASCDACCPGEAACDSINQGCNMGYKCAGTGCQGSYVCTQRY